MLQRGFVTKYAPYLEQTVVTAGKPGDLARRLVEFVEDVNALVRMAQQEGRRQTRRQQRRKGPEISVPARPAPEAKRAPGRPPKRPAAQPSAFELESEAAG